MYTYKVIFVGESGTGKTAILTRLCDDLYTESRVSTIGIDFRIYVPHNSTFKYQIWDTAGQERFKSIISSYYRGTQIAIIVYDISNLSTIQAIPVWINEIQKYSRHDVLFVIVGNKNDKNNIYEKELDDIINNLNIQDNKLLHCQCSAKTGLGVNEIFENIYKKLHTKSGDEIIIIYNDDTDVINTRTRKFISMCC